MTDSRHRRHLVPAAGAVRGLPQHGGAREPRVGRGAPAQAGRNGIQPHFQLAHSAQLETVERLVRRGVYTGPLNITWVAIGGGFDGPNPYTMMEFIRRVPDGASLTLESIMRNVLPINTMAMAMGLHTRCGNEDTLWRKPGEKITSADAVRAARPHRRRARPRRRHGQGSPRDLQARRVLGQRRRGAGEARLPAQPPPRPGRLPAPRLIAACSVHSSGGRVRSPGPAPSRSCWTVREVRCPPAAPRRHVDANTVRGRPTPAVNRHRHVAGAST